MDEWDEQVDRNRLIHTESTPADVDIHLETKAGADQV